jgi:FkbM family methyltransferase
VQQLISYEPDPANAAILAQTITRNHADDRWQMQTQAVSNAAGSMRFLVGRFADSRQALPHEPGITVATVDLFDLDHHVDLLKIDIEGGEWAILRDPRLARLGAGILVMEWHWRYAPDADAHGAALSLLTDAGYTIVADREDQPPGHLGVIWATRPA